MGRGCLASAVAAVCSLLIVTGAAWWTWQEASVAEPVLVKIQGKPGLNASQVNVFLKRPEGQSFAVQILPHVESWYVHSTWISRLYLRVPTTEITNLESVKIVVGTAAWQFTRAQVESWQRQADPLPNKGEAVVVELPSEGASATNLPWVPRVLNWPGDSVFVHKVGSLALGPLILVGLAGFLFTRKPGDSARWRMIVTAEGAVESAGEQGTANERWWNWVGWGFLLLSLAFLELRDPYYFTQDDNLDDCLPMMLVGCRNLWQGYWPEYNPYTFMGIPLLSQGMYALTYPPTWMSYAVARHVLGNEFATVEVFAIFHVLATYWAVRKLAGKVGMGTLCANATGLSISLSGSVLVMGRCWFNFLPTTVWLAVLFLGLVELTRRKVGWRWVLAMGFTSALPFHVGFSQLALYTHCFLALAALYWLLTGLLSRRQILALVAMWLVGAGLSLPIVYQQWQLTRGYARTPPTAGGIGAGWGAFYLPYPFVRADAPTGWGNIRREYMVSLYFAGGVLALCTTLQMTGILIFRPKRPQWAGLVWLFLAVTTFWLALGKAGGLWQVLEHVPLVGFIHRYPMRLLPFVTFFVSLAGGLVLQRMVDSWPKTKQLLAGGVVLILFGWQVAQARTAFFTHGFQPYPPLPAELAGIFFQKGEPTGRLISWAPFRSEEPEHALRMTSNIPAVYGLPALGGYNSLLVSSPLVAKRERLLEQKPVEALGAYGVAWQVLADETPDRPVNLYNTFWWQQVPPQNVTLGIRMQFQRLKRAAVADGITVYKLDDVDPLAFVQSSKQNLALDLHGEGIDVNIRELPGDEYVSVNFLYWPNMAASVDGRPVLCQADDWGRMIVKLAGPGDRLELRYRADWLRGAILGLGVGVLGIFLFYMYRRRPLSLAEAAACPRPPSADSPPHKSPG